MAYQSSKPDRSLVNAIKNASEAFRNGEYELDSDEGFMCLDCGYHGLSLGFSVQAVKATAPGLDPGVSSPDSDEEYNTDDVWICTECGSKNVEIESPETNLKRLQKFGYEYTDFPHNIPESDVDNYLICSSESDC